MGHRVLSRFWHAATEQYVDPGQPCPPLDAATAARLQQAGCVSIDVGVAPTRPQGAPGTPKGAGNGAKGDAAPKGATRAQGGASAKP